MIKHIVCFKLKNNSNEECIKAKNVLMGMKGKVPQIKSINVGIDFLKSERSYDIILEVMLESKKALEDYQNDTYHCTEVKPYMHSVRSGSISVDYEI